MLTQNEAQSLKDKVGFILSLFWESTIKVQQPFYQEINLGTLKIPWEGKDSFNRNKQFRGI